MKYTGILFKGNMVRAIQERRKTQTRRVIKPQPKRVNDDFDGTWEWKEAGHYYDDLTLALTLKESCPYGQVGDRLWVRETWRTEDQYEYLAPRELPADAYIGYKASPRWDEFVQSKTFGRYRPSIHMTRQASRITLEITGVKVVRVQDMSVADMQAEGITIMTELHERGQYLVARDHFVNLWDSINAKRGYGWDVNPWDFALTFKVI